jgi:glycosyltransferase involved in cell wall biosynthesis
MHDNALARALHEQGVDVHLIPTYTPIRTDEDDVSENRVFFGGINVYLQQKLPLFRFLPPFVDRFLNNPALIRWLTSGNIDVDISFLGAMTVSMLKGTAGFQRKEVRRLCDWLGHSVQPHLVNFTNILIGGCIPELRKRLNVPIVVTLQGDDIFLESLPEPWRTRAMQEIYRLVGEVDAFLVHSRFYAQFMTDYFRLPPERVHVVPLGINTDDLSHARELQQLVERPPTIGYLARLAPEKGLHLLVDAFIQLRSRRDDVRLLVAGWLGEQQRTYAQEAFDRLRAAGFETDFEYRGCVDREGKLQFFRDIDLFSVPTTYQEPKGLFVLESLSAGVPVVQPEHGAFPEMLRELGGGRLFVPNDARALAATFDELLQNRGQLAGLGAAGKEAVVKQRCARIMAQQTTDVFEKVRGLRGSPGGGALDPQPTRQHS